MHPLQIVRDAAVAAVTGLPITGARVYVQEPYPWQADQVPGLVLTTSVLPVSEYLEVPVRLRWDVAIDIVARVRGTGDLAAQLDDIAAEVQAAVCALETIVGKPVTVTPVAFDPPEFSGDGEQPIASRRMSFSVASLFSLATTPGVIE